MIEKTICLIVPSLTMGGMERVMSELALYFSETRKHRVSVILLSKREIFYTLPSNITIYEPSAFSKRLPWLLLAFYTIFFVRRRINRINPDAVLSFCEKYNSLAILSALFSGTRVFVSDRASPTISQGRFVDWLNPMVYRLAEGIIAQTAFARDILYRRNNHPNITVIGNPIRSMRMPGLKKEFVVLNVGRFSPMKNQDLLMRYFRNIGNYDWIIVFAGDGERREENERLAAELDISSHVRFVGKVADVQKWYNRAGIFAFTSTSEGFPNVLGEAMSAGLPCISFDCEAGPSDLIEDGKNGFLIPVGDHELYTQRLKELMADEQLRQRLGEAAEQSMDRYRIEQIGEQFLNVLNNGETEVIRDQLSVIGREWSHMEGPPITNHQSPITDYRLPITDYRHYKRLLDTIFSVILLIALSPLLLVVSIMIILTMGQPIFFTQIRTGKNKKEFRIIKFRTMQADNGDGASDAVRITTLGRVLRKLSIDEFPQLINILKGDMSFIGPRPLLPKYLPYYTEREQRRHEVRPGMSGLGQVSGRSYLNWDEQFELDVVYVERLSFKLDLIIFLKTIPKVLGSADMMVTGRIDHESFDVYRQKTKHAYGSKRSKHLRSPRHHRPSHPAQG